ADLAHALGDIVGGRENLLAVLVEEQVIVAEMRAGHMPMEVLGLEIKREHVREQEIERARNFRHGVGAQVGRRIEPGEAQGCRFVCFGHFYLLLMQRLGRAKRAATRGQTEICAETETKGRSSPRSSNPNMGPRAAGGLIVLALSWPVLLSACRKRCG